MQDFKPIEFFARTPEDLDRLIKWARAQRRLVYGEIEITPTLAMAMLDRKCETIRKISRDDVDGYVRDLNKNAWDFTGDGPKFDRRGKLFDGQKRMTACIESGKSFMTVLFFNSIPTNVNGEQRQSAADRLTSTHRELVAAMMRLLEKEKAGKTVFSPGHKPTPREIKECERKAGPELVRIAKLLYPLGTIPASRHAHYGWLVIKLEELFEPEIVAEFFMDLAGGAARGTNIAKLRQRLNKDYLRKAQGGVRNLVISEKTWLIARVFMAEWCGEQLGKLTLPKTQVTQKSILELLEDV